MKQQPQSVKEEVMIKNIPPKLYLLITAIILFPVGIVFSTFTIFLFELRMPGVTPTLLENFLAIVIFLINLAPSVLLTTLWILKKNTSKYLNVLTIFSLLIFAFLNITIIFFPQFWEFFGFSPNGFDFGPS